MVSINPNVDVLILSTDITSEDSVNNLEEIVKARFGVPDILVNGAGSWFCSDTIGESKPKEWWSDFVGYFLSEIPSEIECLADELRAGSQCQGHLSYDPGFS